MHAFEAEMNAYAFRVVTAFKRRAPGSPPPTRSQLRALLAAVLGNDFPPSCLDRLQAIVESRMTVAIEGDAPASAEG